MSCCTASTNGLTLAFAVGSVAGASVRSDAAALAAGCAGRTTLGGEWSAGGATTLGATCCRAAATGAAAAGGDAAGVAAAGGRGGGGRCGGRRLRRSCLRGLRGRRARRRDRAVGGLGHRGLPLRGRRPGSNRRRRLGARGAQAPDHEPDEQEGRRPSPSKNTGSLGTNVGQDREWLRLRGAIGSRQRQHRRRRRRWGRRLRRRHVSRGRGRGRNLIAWALLAADLDPGERLVGGGIGRNRGRGSWWGRGRKRGRGRRRGRRRMR